MTNLETGLAQPAVAVFGYEVVFVHGAWAGPWAWAHWAPFFASEGWTVRTLALPGHSPGDSEFRFGLEDYVAYLEEAVREPEKTVLVGHSMGGWVCLKYMESRRVAASVLVAPMPAGGVPARAQRALARMAPWRSARTLLFGRPAEIGSEADVRVMCFLPDTPEAVVKRYRDRCCPESARACRQMSWLPLTGPRLRRGRLKRTQEGVPHLLLASEGDFFFKPAELEETARLLSAPVARVEGSAHCMMELDGSRALAARVETWLRGRLISSCDPS